VSIEEQNVKSRTFNKIIKIIGKGAYGQVYLVYNKITKKFYAIKHMDKKNILSILNTFKIVKKEIEIHLSENESFYIFIQVLNAINFLHENDLIYRDIKPENILMFENNVVKLCDFGWCVKLNGHQRSAYCGTTEYMSPELVNYKEYGKENDV
jgi:serine/threonine protein kinase